MISHYHQTILGNIPSDWDARSLRSLLSNELSGDWGDDEGEITFRFSAARTSPTREASSSTTWQNEDLSARRLSRFKFKLVTNDLMSLPGLFGDASVISRARMLLTPSNAMTMALDDLQWLADHAGGDDMAVTVDLADLRGYAYYTGMRFAVFAQGPQGAAMELARGGRYDEVGAVFGRKRPAVGFSLDLKELVGVAAKRAPRAAIRAPWDGGGAAGLREAIASLRGRGETVVCVLPGHESEIDEFQCDRELVQAAGQWVVKSI